MKRVMDVMLASDEYCPELQYKSKEVSDLYVPAMQDV